MNSAKMKNDELELMTVDMQSTVTVLGVDSPLVVRLLKAAGCDINEVRKCFLQDYQQEYDQSQSEDQAQQPQSKQQQKRSPTDSVKPPEAKKARTLANKLQSHIVSHVLGKYKELPICCIDTVRTVEPPALFHCHLCAYNLSPETASQVHIAVCSKCFRAVSRRDTVCPACKGQVKKRDVLQIRVGDDTGMLNVIVCDEPCVVCFNNDYKTPFFNYAFNKFFFFFFFF